MFSQSSSIAPFAISTARGGWPQWPGGRADIRHKPVATEMPGRGAGPWPASIAGLGAGARRRDAQLQLPAHSRNRTRGGLPRVRLGAAVVAGGTDAVTETSATAGAGAVHLPAMSLGDVVVVLEDLPASRSSPAAAGGFGRCGTASGGVLISADRLFRGSERLCVRICAFGRRGPGAIRRRRLLE